jgi:hypothetical protein
VVEAATVCGGGSNCLWWRLQPYAATWCIEEGERMLEEEASAALAQVRAERRVRRLCEEERPLQRVRVGARVRVRTTFRVWSVGCLGRSSCSCGCWFVS